MNMIRMIIFAYFTIINISNSEFTFLVNKSKLHKSFSIYKNVNGRMARNNPCPDFSVFVQDCVILRRF